MCESEVPQQSTFFVHLDVVDTSSDDDDQLEPLTTKSWKLQLWRLLQRTPQPIPVLCDEPRSFPHFESERKLSGTSWTSDITHFTDVTMSDSTSAVSIRCTAKGTNENYQTTAVSGDNSSPTSEIPLTDEAKDAADVFTSMKKGIEICLNGNSVNNMDEEKEELSNCQLLLKEGSSSKVQDNKKHQLRKDEESSGCGSRSLSIQGDPEYWEKFRYSKDYQSSLMIETICNEVFNLKPSPRYKSLMKLSKTCKRKGTGKDKKEIELPPKLLVVECNDDNDEKGIKVERLETAEVCGIKRGESASTLKFYTERQDSDKHKKGKVENVIISFHNEQQQMDDDDDDNVEDGVEGGTLKQHKEVESRNSITSSVLTTSTATTEGEGTMEIQRRLQEKLLFLDSFGQAFHGYLTKQETARLLTSDGRYLIRQMWNEEGFILSFMFENEIRNYRLLCDIEVVERPYGSTLADVHEHPTLCTYYLEDRRKCYHTVDELVREGLTTLHLNENAGSYIDLLVELAQFQRNDNLLQTPAAVTPGSRKPSRSSSFRMARLASSSSVIGSARVSADVGNGGGGNGVNMPSITDGGISMDIALIIHYFEEEVFDGLEKCQVCTNGIWGAINKGLRCRDCRLTLHESCIDNVVKSGCKPDLTLLSPFSTDLTTLVKGSRTDSTNESHGPPYILRTCINEVETRGLTAEGIYRICGSTEEIEKLKNLFQKDKIGTSLSQCADIHSITGLIKFFLRQLPDPLITEDVFEEFTNNNASGEMKIDAVRVLVHSLPPAHRLTLKYLSEHFNRVTMEKASNKMNAFNLSSVLMPSILGPANFSFHILESGTNLLHFLITRPEEIF